MDSIKGLNSTVALPSFNVSFGKDPRVVTIA